MGLRELDVMFDLGGLRGHPWFVEPPMSGALATPYWYGLGTSLVGGNLGQLLVSGQGQEIDKAFGGNQHVEDPRGFILGRGARIGR